MSQKEIIKPWEYKQIIKQHDPEKAYVPSIDEIADEGREGWELVNVLAINLHNVINEVFYFKRPSK